MEFALLPEILSSTVRMSVPLILACIAGLWSERSGVVDIGLEGKMLAGAFSAAAAASYFHSAWIGLLLAILVCIMFSLVHGYASITQRGNQVVSGVAINMLAAGLTAAAIAFYVLVYTALLKRRTSQNIVWGGAAGCMPVLIGWAAVTGSLAWTPVVLFGVVFLWTPPHFWALAFRFQKDYAAASVPMLPVVASAAVVARQIVLYTWAMVATSLLLFPVAHLSVAFLAVAVGLGAVFIREAHGLRARVVLGDDPKPMRLFHWSITYLSLLCIAASLDVLVRSWLW